MAGQYCKDLALQDREHVEGENVVCLAGPVALPDPAIASLSPGFLFSSLLASLAAHPRHSLKFSPRLA